MKKIKLKLLVTEHFLPEPSTVVPLRFGQVNFQQNALFPDGTRLTGELLKKTDINTS